MISDFGFRISDFKRAVLLLLLLSAFCLLPSAFGQVHPHSFSPRQLGGMQAWYRADAITSLADGDPVASWVDSTANARTLAQSTADYRPAYRVSIQNGRPAIRFDGSNDMLSGASFAATQWTIFSVQRPDEVALYRTVYNIWPGKPNESNVWATFLNTNNLFFRFKDTTWSMYYPAHSTSITVPEAWSLRFDNVGWTSWVNGIALSPQSETTLVPGGGTNVNVGSWLQDIRQWDGDIFELAFFAEALSDRDRQRVERYLARKWGL